MSHFQNSVSFKNGFRKTVQKASFSDKSKVDFPKTEVLENLHIIESHAACQRNVVYSRNVMRQLRIWCIKKYTVKKWKIF